MSTKGINTVQQCEEAITKGTLFTRNGRDAWRIQGFFREPSATLVNIETGEKEVGALGCRNLEGFVELKPAEEIDEHE